MKRSFHGGKHLYFLVHGGGIVLADGFRYLENLHGHRPGAHGNLDFVSDLHVVTGLANAAIVERVFSLSGLGYLIIDAVVKRDSPVIHAAVLVLALTLVLLDTVAELLQYALRSDMRAAGGRA